MICALTGMEVANASHYDGATAMAEAVIMALSVATGQAQHGRRSAPPCTRSIAQVLAHLHPGDGSQTCRRRGPRPGDLAALADALDEEVACLIVQNPDFLGGSTRLPRCRRWPIACMPAARCSSSSVDPIAWACSSRPAQYGADVVVGEGQPLGNALTFGGPYLGFFAMQSATCARWRAASWARPSIATVGAASS